MYRLVTNWEKSGQNQKDFCQKNGINYSVFKYWNKKWKDEGKIQRISKREQRLSPPLLKANKFIPLTVSPRPESSGLRITYPNGVQVTCPQEIDLEQLKQLIQIY